MDVRGSAGWDPPGVLQGASGMPEMAQGSRWHEPLTLNKRLAVVPGLDPGSASGWDRSQAQRADR